MEENNTVSVAGVQAGLRPTEDQHPAGQVRHTPGPWEIKGRSLDGQGWSMYASSGYGVGKAWDCNGNPENEANARLIAAAPDLYDVLKRLLETESYIDVCGLHPNAPVDEWIADARAALRKAESR